MKEKQRQTWSLRQLFSAANFPVSRSNFRSSSGNVKETGGLRLWEVWTHLLYVGIWPVPSGPDNPFILRTLSRSCSATPFFKTKKQMLFCFFCNDDTCCIYSTKESKNQFEHKLSITFYGLYQFPCCPIILRAAHYLLSSSPPFWWPNIFCRSMFKTNWPLPVFSA